MKKRFAPRCFVYMLLLLLLVMTGCAAPSDTTTPMDTNPTATRAPIREKYEYKQREKVCYFPSFTNENEKTEILSVTMEEGSFTCMTTDEAQADAFINAQRTLLQLLQENGVAVRELNYTALNFDDNFSESEKNRAYIALSSAETWQQVLVTLHALWGEFTDYGYVYAMANTIAAQLGWETDALETAEASVMDAFFCENTEALNLVYPTFTELYATEETVKYSKLLSLSLFEHINWCDAVKKPIETQLEEFEVLLHGYAGKIGASFTRQVCDFAYRGPYLPLCVRTTYATHIVDHGYTDKCTDMYDIYEDYFSDYVIIYQTAKILDREIVEAVERFGLEDRVGDFCFNWLSEYSAMTTLAERRSQCRPALQEAYITTIRSYLHEYYHYIEYLLNPDSPRHGSWQSQAFCEIGNIHSVYTLYAAEKTFTQYPEAAELFYSFTGHTYQPGADDYYEANGITCYVLNEFSFDYHTGGASTTSFSYYLIKDFGEDTVSNLVLFPDTVVDVTGKTWDTLQEEWKQYITDKYAGKEIPDWLSEYLEQYYY